MFYDQDHLRITKIRTTDGTTPLLGPDEKPVKKIVFAPLTKDSKRLLEDQNSRLPNGLKMKIEVIPAYKPEPVPFKPAIDEEKEAMRKELEMLRAEKEASKIPQPNGNGSTVNDQTNQQKTISNEKK